MEPKDMFMMVMKVKEFAEKHEDEWDEINKRLHNAICDLICLGLRASSEVDGTKISPGVVAASCMETLKMLCERFSRVDVLIYFIDEVCRRVGIGESGEGMQDKGSGERSPTCSECCN